MKSIERKIKGNKVLTREQIFFLEKFKNCDLNGIFRLSGGTALSAFYLQHRYSYDLDFFSKERVPFYHIENFLKKINIFKEISFKKVYDRNIFLLKYENGEILNVEFVYYQLSNLEEPIKIEELYVDSFLDILINKLCAIADRGEIKDYVDFYFSLKDSKMSLQKIFPLVEKKCDLKGILEILKYKLLEIPKGIENLNMIKKINQNEIKRYFKESIKKIIKRELRED